MIGKDAFHLPFSTAWEESNEVIFPIDAHLFSGECLQQGVSRKNRVESARFVHRFLERKHANHQIKQPSHLRDASAIPGPDLRANIVEDLAGKMRSRAAPSRDAY